MRTLPESPPDSEAASVDRCGVAPIVNRGDIRSFFSTTGYAIATDRCLQILIILTIAGFALRLYQLGNFSYYIDEAWSYHIVHQSVRSLWDFTTNGFEGTNPPLWYTLEHFMLLFGEDEFILRFIPAVAGTLTIPLFYFVGKECCNKPIGILAAALLTFSPYHVYYSQVAKAYSLSLFFFSFSLLFFLLALRKDMRRSWLLFALFSAAAFSMHYSSIVVTAPLILFAVAGYRSQTRGYNPVLRYRLEAAAVYSVLVFSLSAYVLSAATIKFTYPHTWGYVGNELIVATFYDFCMAPLAGISPDPGFLYPVAWLGIFTFLVGMLLLYTASREKFLLILTSIAIPLAIMYVLSFRVPMDPRYAICLLPFFLLPVAVFFYRIPGIPNIPARLTVSILIIILISIPPLTVYYSTGYKIGEDWKGFAAEIQKIPGNSDTILVVPGFYYLPFTYYYTKMPLSRIHAVSTIAELEQYPPQTGNARVFYVICKPEVGDPSGNLEQWVARHGELVTRRAGISLYRSR